MSTLNSTDLYFLEDNNRLGMGAGKIAQRLKVSEDEVNESRKKVRSIISASELIQELDSKGFTGSIRDTANTILNNPKEPLDFQVDIVKRQAQAKNKATEDKYNVLLKEYESLNEKYNDALLLKDFPETTVLPVFPQYERQGASIIHLGDWHVGKRIESKSVNNFNSYNPEVAKKRSLKCTDSSIRMINKDRQEFENHSTIVHLTGDFIEGFIHPESNQVNNSMTPIEEVAYAQELLFNLLHTLREKTDTESIKVVCVNGNHARVTRRMESSIDHRTSYETMLYAFLAQKFRDEIEFVLPQGDVSYTNILNKTIRTFHGHQVSYGGGIGGLTIPLTKFIHRQNQNKKADYNLLGHYHQFSLPTHDSMLTGCLCGFDNYAQSIGAVKQPALQAYRLIDSRYGLTAFNPLICE